MRKMISFTLIIAIFMLSLVGCANDSSNAKTNIDNNTTENLYDEQNVTNTEDFNDVTMTTTEEKDITTETIVETEIPIAYDIILNDIYDNLQLDPASQQIDNVHFDTGIYEIAIFGDSAEDRMKSISYCFSDVNKDGIEELIITTRPYEEEEGMMILDMYTLVEGTSVLVISGYARDRFYLLDDGMIYNEGSGGAAYSSSALLVFEPGNTELTSKGLYFTYPKDETASDIGFYYNENSIYDVAVSTEISEDEYRAFTNDCRNRIVSFEAKTFDLYTSDKID